MPDELSDREQDGCECLIAIADAFDRGQEVREALVRLFATDRTDTDESRRVLLLRDLRAWFDERPDHSAAYTEWLLAHLNSITESPWGGYHGGTGIEARDLAALLKPFKVAGKPVRADGDKQLRGYKREDLAPVWERYTNAV
jgi:hypothetical protein